MTIRHPLHIYFGNANDNVFPTHYTAITSFNELYAIPVYRRLKQQFECDMLMFLRQKHSIEGLTISSVEEASTLQPFSQNGDFLITNAAHIALGVMTADCLPIILYDQETKAIAIIHAGWRGAIAGIIPQVLDTMIRQYESCAENIYAWIGPSARVCCYQISDDVAQHVHNVFYARHTIAHKKEGLFFDLPAFASAQLSAHGIPTQHIETSSSVCTICDDHFFSYRRQGVHAGRNISLVCRYNE